MHTEEMSGQLLLKSNSKGVKRKVVSTEQWGRNVRKQKRQSGLGYTSTSGKDVPPKAKLMAGESFEERRGKHTKKCLGETVWQLATEHLKKIPHRPRVYEQFQHMRTFSADLDLQRTSSIQINKRKVDDVLSLMSAYFFTMERRVPPHHWRHYPLHYRWSQNHRCLL
ncbi:hypothetical protein J6590_075569 [Homalodisca vitripennis]|nr:hypothetical protein J6590_075569 [Homalodisca vitripennis]